MARLTFEKIASSVPPQTVEFNVPDWGGEVVLRGLDKRELNAIRKSATETDEDGIEKLDVSMYEEYVFCAGMVEPKIEHDMYAELLKTHAGTITKVLNKIFRLSKVGRDDLKEIGRNFPV